LNSVSYQSYVDILGEHTIFENSFFSNYIDILFTDRNFKEASKISYLETSDVYVPFVIILMRIFSAILCSGVVTAISSYVIGFKVLNEGYFSIFTLIIFTVEFFKAYLSNQIVAYGPQVVEVCVFKNNK